MTADDFAKTRDREKDMRIFAELVIDNLVTLIEDDKRPFGSSSPIYDVLDAIGHTYDKAGEDRDRDGSVDYALRLLDELPDYLREKLKDAEPPDRGASLLGP